MQNNVETFNLISTGLLHTCFTYKRLFILECIGKNNFGQTDVPDAYSHVYLSPVLLDLATGSSHNCLIDNNLSLVCWGKNDEGQNDIPSEV